MSDMAALYLSQPSPGIGTSIIDPYILTIHVQQLNCVLPPCVPGFAFPLHCKTSFPSPGGLSSFVPNECPQEVAQVEISLSSSSRSGSQLSRSFRTRLPSWVLLECTHHNRSSSRYASLLPLAACAVLKYSAQCHSGQPLIPMKMSFGNLLVKPLAIRILQCIMKTIVNL
jgi:hypothetical protein